MATTQKSWLSNLFSKIASWFSSASNEVHDVTVLADNIANAIKNVAESPTGQAIETALEMVIPASTGLVNAFNLELPNIVTKLNWAVVETSKTGDQLVNEGLKYLAGLKGTDDYVIQLNSFAAKVQKWFSDNQGLGLTIQQALLTPQIVHNPQLVTIANEVIADINTASNAVSTVVTDTNQALKNANTPT